MLFPASEKCDSNGDPKPHFISTGVGGCMGMRNPILFLGWGGWLGMRKPMLFLGWVGGPGDARTHFTSRLGLGGVGVAWGC